MGVLKKLSSLTEKLGIELKKADRDRDQLELYKKLYDSDALKNRKFYNVGAGDFSHPYWTNVDFFSDWYKDWAKYTEKGINYNLFSQEPFPIEDNISEVVYTSHTIEHIDDSSAQYFFNEAHRILKPRGIFRITCPDIELTYRAYKNADEDFFYWKTRFGDQQPSIEQLFVQRFATAITEIPEVGIDPRITTEEIRDLFDKQSFENALNHCTSRCTVAFQKKHPGNHMNWWSYSKAEKMLQTAGFKTIYRSGHGQSNAPILRNTNHFDKTHLKMSLYLEAVKSE